MAVTSFAPENISLHARLSACFAGLPPAEQKVATYLLQHVVEYPDLPIAELASRAKVSKAVVVRMCQFLGFSGYREFRLTWARESPWQNERQSNQPRILSNVLADLQSTQDLLSTDAIDHAAQAIVKAKHFFIYGSGCSYRIGQLAAASCNDMGRLAVTFSESGWRSNQPVLADADTAVLVISHRGANPVIERVVKGDKSSGATIVTLTSNPYSALAKYANILLLTGSPSSADSKSAVPPVVRVVQMACVYVLVARIQKLLETDALI